MTCPYCKKPIDQAKLTLTYHKEGWTAPCPECKRTIMLRRFVTPVRDRPKHQSKKERLRLRAEKKAAKA